MQKKHDNVYKQQKHPHRCLQKDHPAVSVNIFIASPVIDGCRGRRNTSSVFPRPDHDVAGGREHGSGMLFHILRSPHPNARKTNTHTHTTHTHTIRQHINVHIHVDGCGWARGHVAQYTTYALPYIFITRPSAALFGFYQRMQLNQPCWQANRLGTRAWKEASAVLWGCPWE